MRKYNSLILKKIGILLMLILVNGFVINLIAQPAFDVTAGIGLYKYLEK